MPPIVGKSYGLNLLSMHTLQAPTVIILCVLNAKFVCSNGYYSVCSQCEVCMLQRFISVYSQHAQFLICQRFISVYSQHAQFLICQRFISVYCQFVFLSGVCATTDVGRTFRREFTLVREVRTTAASRRLRKTDWCLYSVFV